MGTGIETKPQILWELPEGKYQGFCPVGAESWGYQLQSKLLNSWMLLGLECWNLSMHLGPRAWVGSWNPLGGLLYPQHAAGSLCLGGLLDLQSSALGLRGTTTTQESPGVCADTGVLMCPGGAAH